MESKSILKIFLIMIFIIGTLSFAYANGGPLVGENQAKKSVQSYLNSNNLSYTAITPGWDDLQVEVKDTKTGEVKWIPESEYESDEESHLNDFSGRYELINGFPLWIVQVNDKNNKNVGQIYVDANDGEVLKAIINGKVLKDIVIQKYPIDAYFYFSDTINTVGQIFQGVLDNIGLILGILGAIILVMGIGIGYLIYNNRMQKQ